MEYYTTDEILRRSDISIATLERWRSAFRGTHMVKRHNGRVFYTEHFLHFITQRKEELGPSALPDPTHIALLYELWDKFGNATEISMATALPTLIIERQLQQLGLNNGKQES